MAERTQSVASPEGREPSTDTTTARVEIPTEEFALAELFEAVPDARVQVEPTIANPADHALVLVSADEHEHDAVGAALRGDRAFGTVEPISEREVGWTYRVTWEGRTHQLLCRTIIEGVTILEAWGRRDHWCFRLLAPDRETLSRTHEVITELGYRPEYTSIRSADRSLKARSDVTDRQREALVAAFEKGYYGIPRDVSAVELADDLDISHQALSERLRRAHSQLVETELITKGGTAG